MRLASRKFGAVDESRELMSRISSAIREIAVTLVRVVMPTSKAVPTEDFGIEEVGRDMALNLVSIDYGERDAKHILFQSLSNLLSSVDHRNFSHHIIFLSTQINQAMLFV